MPRVGSTENERAPLWTSIKSTPSRSPPRRVRLRIDQSCGVARRRLSLLTAKLSTQRSLTTSVSVQDLKRVMSIHAVHHGDDLAHQYEQDYQGCAQCRQEDDEVRSR